MARIGEETGQNACRSDDCFYNVACLNNIADLLKGLDRSVSIILLKGAALLNTVYSRDVGLRHLGDVDVLIRIKDFSAFKTFLADRGYVFYDSLREPRPGIYLNSVTCSKRERFWPNFHIHWHLANATFPTSMFCRSIDLEKIWQEAGTLEGYENVWIMSPHHQLIHLSEHALKHAYDRPYFLKDINDLVEYYNGTLSWDAVISEAKRFNLSRPVYYSLYFANKVLATGLPARVLPALAPRRFTVWERRFVGAILKGKRVSSLSVVAYLAMNKTWADKLRFLLRALVIPAGLAAGIKNGSSCRLDPLVSLRRAYGRCRIYGNVARSLIISDS